MNINYIIKNIQILLIIQLKFITFKLYSHPYTQTQPLSAADLADDLEYADVDFRSYGPINYKAASIYALVKKNKNGNLKEIGK